MVSFFRAFLERTHDISEKILLAALFTTIVLPSFAGAPFAAQKGSVVAIGSAFVLLALFFLFRQRLDLFFRGTRSLLIASALFAVLLLLTSLWQGISGVELIGTAFEFGSVLSFLILAIFLLAGYVLAESERGLVASSFVIIVGALIVNIFYLVPPVIGIKATPLFGDWTSTQLLSAFSFILAMGLSLHGEVRGYRRFVLYWAQAVSLFILLFSGLSALILGVGMLSLILLGFAKHRDRFESLQWVINLVLTLVLFLSAFFGSLPPTVGPPMEAEVRPSGAATWNAMLLEFGAKPRTLFFGSGPSSFAYVWDRHRSLALNESEFWDRRFESGVSSLQTLFVTHGIPLALSLCVLISIPLAFLWRSFVLRRATAGVSLPSIMLGYATVSILGLAALWFWNLHIAFISLVAFSLGATLRPHMLPATHEVYVSERWTRLCVLLVSGILLFAGITRSIAHHDFAEAERALAADSHAFDKAEKHLLRSRTFAYMPEIERELIQLYIDEIRTSVADGGQPSQEEYTRLLALGKKAVDAGSVLTEAYPAEHRNWIEYGRAQFTYSLLSGETNFLEGSNIAFGAAQNAARAHPLPPFMLAQLLIQEGKINEAEEQLKLSLELKPNYTQAQELLHALRTGEL